MSGPYLTLMKGLKESSWPIVEGMVGRFFSLRACLKEAGGISDSHNMVLLAQRGSTYLGPGQLLLDGFIVRLNMLGIQQVTDCVLVPTVHLLETENLRASNPTVEFIG